jgi:phage-related holin
VSSLFWILHIRHSDLLVLLSNTILNFLHNKLNKTKIFSLSSSQGNIIIAVDLRKLNTVSYVDFKEKLFVAGRVCFLCLLFYITSETAFHVVNQESNIIVLEAKVVSVSSLTD